jgi:hypothetical protein
MVTKQELEARIAQLEQTCREFQGRLNKTGERELIRVQTSRQHQYSFEGMAPYIKAEMRSPDSFSEKIMRPLVEALKKHAITPVPGVHWYVGNKGDVRLGTYTDHDNPIFLPEAVVDAVLCILDTVADFGFDCWFDGHAQGAALLTRLANSEISADQFDGSVEQERARKQQRKSLRKFTNLKHLHKQGE